MLKSGGSILDANPGSDLDAIQQVRQKMWPSGLKTAVTLYFRNRRQTLFTVATRISSHTSVYLGIILHGHGEMRYLWLSILIGIPISL